MKYKIYCGLSILGALVSTGVSVYSLSISCWWLWILSNIGAGVGGWYLARFLFLIREQKRQAAPAVKSELSPEEVNRSWDKANAEQYKQAHNFWKTLHDPAAVQRCPACGLAVEKMNGLRGPFKLNARSASFPAFCFGSPNPKQEVWTVPFIVLTCNCCERTVSIRALDTIEPQPPKKIWSNPIIEALDVMTKVMLA